MSFIKLVAKSLKGKELSEISHEELLGIVMEANESVGKGLEIEVPDDVKSNVGDLRRWLQTNVLEAYTGRSGSKTEIQAQLTEIAHKAAKTYEKGYKYAELLESIKEDLKRIYPYSESTLERDKLPFIKKAIAHFLEECSPRDALRFGRESRKYQSVYLKIQSAEYADFVNNVRKGYLPVTLFYWATYVLNNAESRPEELTQALRLTSGLRPYEIHRFDASCGATGEFEIEYTGIAKKKADNGLVSRQIVTLVPSELWVRRWHDLRQNSSWVSDSPKHSKTTLASRIARYFAKNPREFTIQDKDCRDYYASIIIQRLFPTATRSPFIAKGLLGHENAGDATLSYMQYVASEDLEELDLDIKLINVLQEKYNVYL